MNDRKRLQPRGGAAVRALLMLLLAATLSGCATRGGKIPYDPPNFGAPDKTTSAEIGYDLPLGPLDIVRVNVFRVPELSGDYQVDGKGILEMPLIGPLNVRELSPQQFATQLEQRYGERHLNNPEITVRIMNTPSSSITVEGGVNSPGVYSLQSRTTLLGAIALARGIALTDANARRVAIFRKIDGKMNAAAFDLVAIRRAEMNDPMVYPGDMVVVDSSQNKPLFRDIMSSLPLLSIFLTL